MTSPPAQVLACIPKKKTPDETADCDNIEQTQNTSVASKISGVQGSSTTPETTSVPTTGTLAGVQNPLSGGQTSQETPNQEEKLPDLVRNTSDNDDYRIVLESVPTVGDKPPNHIFNGTTTEEEFDVVDTLLSLSTPPGYNY